MTQPIKFYFDLLSQPCRALYMFLEASKIPYEAVSISLMRGEHLSNDFKNNINRFQKVPAIKDEDFKLSESIAIFRYLVREKIVPEHWYPHKGALRARIDEYMEWQHGNMRACCTDYFRQKWLQPKLTNTEPNPEQVAQSEARLNKCLAEFEQHWLKGEKYMITSNITIADLLAICEIDQPKAVGFNPFKNYPRIADWHELTREALEPYYHEANQVIDKIEGKQKEKVLQMKN
ncbi:unnamed protein product [Hermetia illucens]|uniref:glutathione transferase n=1 Tax=Hermetia illucens TaxID=343691 RepID=A0A7R8V0E0_HERIL|nr:glutathione S-transferase theta-3 [Hermetia illucens]CAD7090269.1 unnamed protein product [Hermetia illucens]